MELVRSLIRVVVGASVGPFAQCCLNEALGLSVSPRGVGPGEDLAKAEAFAGCSELNGCAASAGLASRSPPRPAFRQPPSAGFYVGWD